MQINRSKRRKLEAGSKNLCCLGCLVASAGNQMNQTKMKNIKNPFLLPALIAVLNLIPAGRVTAQPLTTLHGFTALGVYPYQTNSDGATPHAGLITTVSGNTLYGTAAYGGSSGSGTVFSLSLPVPPQLAIIPVVGSVILTWPTDFTGYTLQSSTNLGSSAVWTTNLPSPVVVNGQNAVTNPIFGAQEYFRLMSN